MSRRGFLVAAGTVAMATVACTGTERRNAAGAYTEIASAKPRPTDPTILVCMPRTSHTMEVWSGLRDELGKDFRLVAVEVANRDGAPVIAEGVRRHRPSAIVLMNNPTLAAYREFQRTSVEKTFPPAVVVMTSFLERGPLRTVATTGISYEVPLITVVTNLRRLVVKPVREVGVVVRRPLRNFVNDQAVLALREHIGVVEESVSAAPNPSELKRALRRIKQRVDALWILNDDHLLTPGLIADGWLPGLNERPWIPSIVGAGSLVSPGQSFGTFAMLPDHTALGVQAANLLLDIADNGWALTDNVNVQLPLSTTTTIDLVQARERFVLRKDALQKVDRVLQ